MIFAGGYDKGPALLDWLSRLQLPFHRIIVIDDRLQNIKNLEETLAGKEIDFAGWHYRAADATARAYDSRVANLQLEMFERGHLLSDDEARFELSKRSCRLLFVPMAK